MYDATANTEEAVKPDWKSSGGHFSVVEPNPNGGLQNHPSECPIFAARSHKEVSLRSY